MLFQSVPFLKGKAKFVWSAQCQVEKVKALLSAAVVTPRLNEPFNLDCYSCCGRCSVAAGLRGC